MRILFFSHYFPPEVNAPATRTYQHCRRWVKAGCAVTVITCAPNCPKGVLFPGYRNKLFQKELIDGITVIRVWTFLAANTGVARRTLNYLSYLFAALAASFLIPKPDLIIATSPQFFCGWAGVLAAFFRRRPFVLEIRDIWPASIGSVEAISNKWVLKFLTLLEVLMYKAARHIVTVGEGYKQELLERRIPASKISVVPNGVDADLFLPGQNGAGFRSRFALGDAFLCSYIGTIGLAHGLETVLKAAALAKDSGAQRVKFVLVGDGARRQELEAAARRQNLDNVIFTGLLPKDEMPQALAAADCCLVHLKDAKLFRTVLPSKIFEMLAMEKPILMGVLGDAAALVEKAQAGLVFQPEDAEALVHALLQLMADPASARRMGQNGRSYVIKAYNRDQLATQYLTLLQGLL